MRGPTADAPRAAEFDAGGSLHVTSEVTELVIKKSRDCSNAVTKVRSYHAPNYWSWGSTCTRTTRLWPAGSQPNVDQQVLVQLVQVGDSQGSSCGLTCSPRRARE